MKAHAASPARRGQPSIASEGANGLTAARPVAATGVPRYLGGAGIHAPAAAAPVPIGGRGDACERQANAVAVRASIGGIGTAATGASGRHVRRPALVSPTATTVLASTPPLEAALATPGPGQPLDPAVRRRVEPALGRDLSWVRVHSGGDSNDAARSLDSRAFTHGRNIHLGPHERSDDLALLSHEAVHAVQQSESGVHLVQRFEAGHHESIERSALGGSGGLSQQEITQIYVGNWMRDVNQVFVPTMQQAIPHQVRFALLKYMGIKKFGQSFSAEQMGFYIPAEHIDSPAGLLQPDPAAGIAGDVLPRTPTVDVGAATDAIPDRGLGDLATPQASVSPDAAVGGGIDANIFSVDQSGVMAFLRRSNQHIERRLMLASQAGRDREGLMHFGAALHSVEDLFAHSNWIEIAANKVLAEEPSLIADELGPDERTIFHFSRTLPAGPHRAAHVAESRPILTTGSFVTLDTAISVSHELMGFMREGLHAESDERVGEAQKELLIALVGQYGGDYARQYVAIMQAVPFPQIPAAVLNRVYARVNPILAGFANQLEAHMAEQRVSQSSLLAARDANSRAARGEFSSISEQMMELEARFGGPPVEAQRALSRAEAAERERAFAATPEEVLAGPSHSQIAKDHGNSIFFGIAFHLATRAVAMMGEKMNAVWSARDQSAPYRRPRPAPAHPNEAGYPWQDGWVPPWERGRGPTPLTSRNFAADMERRESESHQAGESINRHGHAEGQAYDLQAMRDESATRIRGVAAVIRFVGEALGQARSVDSEVPDTLVRLADDLRSASEAVRDARTYDERHAANVRLEAIQQALFVQIALYRAHGDASVFATYETLLGVSMTAFNREVATTAVAFSPEQRAHFDSPDTELEVSNIDLGEPDLSGFAGPALQGAVRDLVMTSRRIVGHPYDDAWWRADMHAYIERNAAQFAEEVRARNAGWAGFRHGSDGHGH